MSAIAHCSIQPIGGNKARFRIIPAGLFKTADGRPHGLAGWFLDGITAAAIIAVANARQTDFLIDYEHQSLATQGNGQPVPAAGWFRKLEWREGDGLYVADARWTEKAAAMLAANEYRYVSPVFSFDAYGRVTSLLSVAITNAPALDGLTDLAAASVVRDGKTIIRDLSEAELAACRALGNNPADYLATKRRDEATALQNTGIGVEDDAKLRRVFGDDYAANISKQA